MLMNSSIRFTGHVQHLIDSFDFYMDVLLKDIIREHLQISVLHESGYLHILDFDPNVRYSPPEHRQALTEPMPLTPEICREGIFRYAVFVLCSLRYRVYRRRKPDEEPNASNAMDGEEGHAEEGEDPMLEDSGEEEDNLNIMGERRSSSRNKGERWVSVSDKLPGEQDGREGDEWDFGFDREEGEDDDEQPLEDPRQTKRPRVEHLPEQPREQERPACRPGGRKGVPPRQRVYWQQPVQPQEVEDLRNWVLVQEQIEPNYPLFRQPLMVGSRHGSHTREEGGFFLLKGEKSLQCIERLQSNYPFVFQVGPSKYMGEIRSIRESKVRSTSTLKMEATCQGFTWEMRVKMPFVDYQWPLRYLVYAIGGTPEEFCQFLRDLGGSELQEHRKYQSACDDIANMLALQPDDRFSSRQELFAMISRKVFVEPEGEHSEDHLQHILTFEFLPHLGEDAHPETQWLKRFFMAILVHRVLKVHLRIIGSEHRDQLHHARVDNNGYNLALLARQGYRQFVKSISRELQKQGHEANLAINNFVNGNQMSSTLANAISTGAWTSKVRTKTQNGLTLPLNHQNLAAMYAHQRRILKPINKEGKNAEPRMLSKDSFWYKCLADTPEGQACGLVNNLSILGSFRIGFPSETVLLVAYELGVIGPEVPRAFAAALRHPDSKLVLVNGLVAGVHERPEELMAEVRRRRREQPGWIPRHISVFSRERFVFLNTDAGDWLRPVIYLPALPRLGKILREYRGFKQVGEEDPAAIRSEHDAVLRSKLFSRMLEEGVVEYLTASEEDHFCVAITPGDVERAPPGTYTHLEVHPCCALGISAALIPKLDMNQSPRNVLQCSMIKQNIGERPPYLERVLGSRYDHLWYAETAAMQTFVEGLTRVSQQAYGTNLLCAQMCWDGYNMEDAIIVNQRAVDNAYCRVQQSRVYQESTRAPGTDVVKLTRPDPATWTGLRMANYGKIDPAFGCIRPGTAYGPGDMVIGKGVTTREKSGGGRAVQTRDRSIQASKDETNARVHAAYTFSEENYEVLKVVTTQTMHLEVGDKMSSRHGQKGVVGRIIAAEDAPFIPALGGISPDIIITPHAITGRMTIGHEAEMLLSMLAGYRGCVADGTPFQDMNTQEVGTLLRQCGLSEDGCYTMCDGRTGEAYETKIYVGYIYYQRLKQICKLKLHQRARGPKHPVTNQPTDGRARDGGLRFGQMESDTLVAHGAANVVKERLFEQSDFSYMPVCRRCGMIASSTREDLRIASQPACCQVCRVPDTIIERFPVPYPFKLLMQECMAMNCCFRLTFDSPDHPTRATALEVVD